MNMLMKAMEKFEVMLTNRQAFSATLRPYLSDMMPETMTKKKPTNIIVEIRGFTDPLSHTQFHFKKNTEYLIEYMRKKKEKEKNSHF